MEATNEAPHEPVDESPTNEAVVRGTPPLPLPKVSKKSDSGGRKRAIVWDHFTKLQCEEGERPRAACNYCGANYACDSKQNRAMSLLCHIGQHCKKYPFRNQDKRQKRETEEGEGGGDLVVASFSVEACRKALAEMLIIDELPFKFVENEGSHRFMHVVCPRWVEIPSRIMVAKDCFGVYTMEKEKLKSALKGQRVCLTTDTWTSVQNLNYMCLTVHFIDSDWKLHKRILNFCLVENHKGWTLSKVIEMCLLGWGIDKFLTVTVDNASSNSLLIQFLTGRTKHRMGTMLGHKFLHVRCCAHILNLIVCDGLREMNDSIVKVRNAVRYVRSSPSRMRTFMQCAEKEGITCKSVVCLDVPTSWNSTYMMLDGAEKFQRAFERLDKEDENFLSWFREGDSSEDDKECMSGEGRGKENRDLFWPPNSCDWEKVRMFVKFLKLFYNATLRFSGSLHVTSNSFLTELFFLQSSINQMCRHGNRLLSSMAESMRTKFEKYWGNFDNVNLLLFVAVVLDPRYKLKFVKFCFGKLYESVKAKDLTKRVEDTLTQLIDWYVANEACSSVQDQNKIQSCELIVNEDKEDVHGRLASGFRRYMEEEDLMGSKLEADKYLAESLEVEDEKFDVLGWWKNNSNRYHILSQVARDVLAIPMSTVASESAFSTSGRVLDPFRSSLSPNMVEALICAQNWIRTSSTPISLRDAMDDVEEYEKLESVLMEASSSEPMVIEG